MPNAITAQPNNGWLPSDNGLLGGLWDPGLSQNTSIAVAGTGYMIRLPVRSQQLISTLWMQQTIVGAGASTGTFIGLISALTGNLLSVSADLAPVFTSGAVMLPFPLLTPVIAGPANPVYAQLITNMVTQPTMARGGNPIVMNGNTPNTAYRWAVNGTGMTSLGNVSLAANTLAGATCYWVGWS